MNFNYEAHYYGFIYSFEFSIMIDLIIDDCAKDGGKEFFTKMQCVLLSNSYRIVKDS